LLAGELGCVSLGEACGPSGGEVGAELLAFGLASSGSGEECVEAGWPSVVYLCDLCGPLRRFCARRWSVPLGNLCALRTPF